MTTPLNKYTLAQSNTLYKMKQYQFAYNRLEDSIIKFKEIKRELDELNAIELDAFLSFIESGKMDNININEDKIDSQEKRYFRDW